MSSASFKHLRLQTQPICLLRFGLPSSGVSERVSASSARPAAPRSRTLWLRCRAALCSTCSVLGSFRPPASGAAWAAVSPAASSAASAPVCRASSPTAPGSPQDWFYREFWRGEMRWGHKHISSVSEEQDPFKVNMKSKFILYTILHSCACLIVYSSLVQGRVIICNGFSFG